METAPPEAEGNTSIETYTPEAPWLNRKPEDGDPPDDEATRATFAKVLQSGLRGAKLNAAGQPPNVYVIFGFASQGYAEDHEGGWAHVVKVLEEWCLANDERHREAGTGWILMTQGDGDYGKKSIESIAQYIRTREPAVPVVFIQSNFGYAEPGTPYWPTYASAGFFGPGVFHQKQKLDKEGKPRTKKDGSPMLAEAWGGYVKDENGTPTGQLGFPDDAIIHQSFGTELLRDHLGGIFVAGGGDITAEQVALYGLRTQGRPGDCFVPAVAVDHSESKLNGLLAPGYKEDAEGKEKETAGVLKVTLQPPKLPGEERDEPPPDRGCCNTL